MSLKKQPKSSKTLGHVIASLRKKLKLSRYALAQQADVDATLLLRLERSSREGVHFSTVCRLADALGVSLDYLAVQAGLRSSGAGAPTTSSDAGELRREAARSSRLIRRALTDLDRALGTAPQRRPRP